jgi:hypothetical protein
VTIDDILDRENIPPLLDGGGGAARSRQSRRIRAVYFEYFTLGYEVCFCRERQSGRAWRKCLTALPRRASSFLRSIRQVA